MSTLRIRVLLLLAAGVTVATADCLPSGRGTFATGLEALSRGDLPTAEMAFELLVKTQPDCAAAHNNLAAVLVEQGRIEPAADHLRRALQLRPDYQRARFNLNRLEPLLAAMPASTPITPPAAQAAAAPPTPTLAPYAAKGIDAANALPRTLIALEGEGATACVVEPDQNQICVYRRDARAIVPAACFPILSARVQQWPSWLVASDLTARRIRLVDEHGRRRLRVIPEHVTMDGNVLRLRRTDFQALSSQVVPWRTGWAVHADRAGLDGAPVADLRAALEQWRGAWERKDIEAYAGAYDDRFIPQSDSSRAQWRIRKSAIFAQPGALTVAVTAPSIFLLDADAAVTIFDQTYGAGAAASHARKVLRWQRTGERWKISAETALTEWR